VGGTLKHLARLLDAFAPDAPFHGLPCHGRLNPGIAWHLIYVRCRTLHRRYQSGRAAGSNVWEFAMAFFDGHFRSLLVIHTIVVCILLGVAVVMMR